MIKLYENNCQMVMAHITVYAEPDEIFIKKLEATGLERFIILYRVDFGTES